MCVKVMDREGQSGTRRVWARDAQRDAKVGVVVSLDGDGEVLYVAGCGGDDDDAVAGVARRRRRVVTVVVVAWRYILG